MSKTINPLPLNCRPCTRPDVLNIFKILIPHLGGQHSEYSKYSKYFQNVDPTSKVGNISNIPNIQYIQNIFKMLIPHLGGQHPLRVQRAGDDRLLQPADASQWIGSGI